MFFRASPSALPQSRSFLVILVAISLFVSTLSLKWRWDWQMSISVAIYAIISHVVLIYLLLAACNKANRFVKTASAVLLISLFFQAISLPVPLLLTMHDNLNQGLVLVLEIVFMWIHIWLTLAHAHILHCALEVNRWLAIFLVIMISFIQYKVLETMVTL